MLSVREQSNSVGTSNDHVRGQPVSYTQVNERLTNHSGIACKWKDDLPIIPSESFARRVGQFIKRAFDIIVSGSALIVLSPLFLFVAIAIKKSDPKGGVFFLQNRVGYKGRIFKIFKFRTMYMHACDHSGVSQTQENDVRVFPFARKLRKKSIDELPQLINVFLGTMSLVGPRPHVAGQVADGIPYSELVPYYDLRNEAKPGITGWAQANGFRGPTHDTKLAMARIDHDMAYIQNQSLWLDIKTLVLTVWHEVAFGKAH